MEGVALVRRLQSSMIPFVVVTMSFSYAASFGPAFAKMFNG
jgi:hypothetical protein